MNEAEKKTIRLMEYPRCLSEEDVRSAEEETMRGCRLIDDMALILEEESNRIPVDAEKELRAFHRNNRKKALRRWMGWSSGVAAAALLVWGFLKIAEARPEVVPPLSAGVVLEADPSPQHTTLEIEAPQKAATSRPAAVKMEAKEMDYSAETTVKTGTQTHILRIARGHTFKLTLSDGTEVFLNAGSRLTYPTRFTRAERVVSLEGEAYFKVARDEKHPFIVRTQYTRTCVLGTEFNVSSYSASDTHVTLIAGRVQVEAFGHSRMMEPGQDLCVREDGSMETNTVDLQSYLYWRDGYFYFDNLPLVDIMKSLGRWYNVGVEFRNTEVMQSKMHFLSDRREGLEHTLLLLNRMEKAHFIREGNKIIVE